jgi:hypothetical protein
MFFSYSELVDRNWAFVEKSTQDKIKESKLLFVGCGLGSVIAQCAARLGFQNFILADGDTVDLSNLNRQSFSISQIGINKAKALSDNIKEINPEANIIIIDKFIKQEDVSELIEKADFIVNTVDISPVYFDITQKGASMGKCVFLPLNVAFGCFNWIFTKKSKKLEDIVGKPEEVNSELIFYKKILKKIIFKVPFYILKRSRFIFSEIEKKKKSPQLVIGATLVAGVVVTSMVKILNNEKVSVAPKYFYLDLYKEIR